MADNPFLQSPFEQLNETVSDRFALPKTETAELRQPAKTSDNYLPPSDMRPIFESAAREFDVPVNVLMALGHQESRYNPNAIGQPTQWGRAKGMMQYLDSTAKSVGINPFDPTQAIPAAARQLRERLDKGYSMEDAVKEHFAGPDRKLWGEKTRAYGQEVMTKVGKIGELLGANAPSPQAKPAAAQDIYEDLNKDDPGRYRAPTQAELEAFEAGQQDAAKKKQADADNQGFFDRAGKAVSSGYDNMMQSLGTAKFVMAGGDSNELAKSLASKFKAEQDKQKTTGEQEIDKAFQGVTDAKGVWDTTKAGAKAIGTALANPKDLAVGIAEQAPNMLPTMAAGVGGAGAGAAVGGGVGAAVGGIGAVPGAIGGAIWGGRAGMVAGTTAVELGSEVEQMVLERLQAGQQTPTEQNIKTLLDDKTFQSEARERGLKKGLTVGIVDQIFMGLGGKVATKAVTAPTTARKIGLGAGAVGLDAVGETTGEAASQLVARGEVDKGDALREGVYGFGQSVVEPAIGAGMSAAKRAGQAMRPQPAAPTPAQQAQAVAAENNIPNIVIEGTADGQQVATVTPAQPSKAAGPLSRAIENAADQPARVTVTAPEGQITGFVQSATQDAQGNAVTRILGDDGQVYTFTSADNVQIKPESGPLTGAVEKAAAQTTAPALEASAQPAEIPPVEQNQQVTDATLTNEGTKPAEPIDVTGRTDKQLEYLSEKGQTGWKEAAQTELAKRRAAKPEETAKPAEPKLEDMSEPDLRARLKYLANQAKTNGGWNKMLIAERKKVEKFINQLTEKANDQRNAADLPVRDDQPAVAPVAAAQQADQQGTGTGGAATAGAGAAVSEAPVSGAGANVSGTDSAADAKPALGKDLAGAKPRYAYGNKQFDLTFDSDIDRAAYIAAQKTPSKRDADYVKFVSDSTGMTEAQVREHGAKVRESIKAMAKDAEPGTIAVATLYGQQQQQAADTKQALDSHAGKWFGSREKADAYVAKKSIAATHEVVQTGKVRFEIKPITTKQEQQNGNQAAETVETQAQEPQASDTGASKGVRDKLPTLKEMLRDGEGWWNGSSAADRRALLESEFTKAVTDGNADLAWNEMGQGMQERIAEMLDARAATAALKAEQQAPRATVIDNRDNKPGEYIVRASNGTNLATFEIGRNGKPVRVKHFFEANETRGLADQAMADFIKERNSEIDRLFGAEQKAEADQQPVADAGPHFAAGRQAFGEGKPRELPSYFTKKSGKNAKDWLRGYDAAKAEANPVADKDGNTIVGRRSDGVMIRQDKNGVRFYFDSGVRISETVAMRPTRAGVVLERGELKPDFMTAEEEAEAAPKAKPAVSANTVFTEDAAAKARALLKSKLNQFNSGIDPEILQAGITLAGYHIEKGARTFSAYAKAMIEDLGDAVKPYLKSWYMGVKYDPRAAGFDGMDSAADVETADVDGIIATNQAEPTIAATETENADTTTTPGSDGNRALEGAPAEQVRSAEEGGNAEQRGAEGGRTDAGRASEADRTGDTGGSRVGDGAGDVPVPARGTRSQRGSAGQRRVQAQRRAQPDDARPVAEQQQEETAAARKDTQAAGDYRITDLTRLGEGGQKTKYRNNVAAIRLLNELQQTGRHATPDEQDVLARYVGWGGIAQAFDETNKEWSDEYAELKSLLTPEEWEAAKESTQYAHYTSQEIITGMYDALKRFGFGGGTILEPGSGVGNFIGLMPEDMRNASRFTAVERERIAGGIAKALYPNQNVQLQDFRKFNAQDGYFDVVTGNPPFSSTTLTDLSGRKHLSGLSIHNYFFAKAVDMLREGGVMAQVVSNSFLDAKGDKARRYIGERTEFLGAIRLPNKAFAKNANTEVTTDIIFLKKRPESQWGSKEAKDGMKRWLDVGSVPDPLGGDPIPLNQYFIDNPQMMLGRMERSGSMYRADAPALIAREGQNTADLMREAIGRLPENVYVAPTVLANEAMQQAEVVALDKAANVDVGGHYVKDGKVFVRMGDIAGEGTAVQLTASTKISEKRELGANGLDRIKNLADMRVTVRNLLAAEIKDSGDIEGLRKTLNDQYDAYVKKYGFINARGTVQLFGDDPDFPLLASLEMNYDPGVGAAAAKNQGIKPVPAKADKATIFSRRVIEKHEEVTKADSPADALVISIAERGRIDADYIGKLLGKDGSEVLDGLTKGDNPALFVDPATGGYVLADEYLSGNVRKKLKQAKAAGQYGNVAALEKVIPEDIPAHEISGKIGAPWISTAVYEEFAAEIMGEGTRAKVTYVSAMSSYVTGFEAGSDVTNKNTFGTPRMGADEIYTALLNSKEIRVGHYEEDPQTRSRRFVLEKEPTDEANDKAREIKDKFNDWLFSDAERAEAMQRAYNDAVNNYVTRVFDGSMLKLPGKVPDVIIKLRRHQRNAVSRIIQDGRALLDHVVGAGKTFTVIAAAMELKRTGLAKKPMIVVPNHLVKQWAADFYRLYPGANILTATKKDFQKANRRKFLAKIATGNWDAVIIAHSSYGFIKPDQEFEARFNEERIDEIVEAIQALKSEKDQESKRTVKQLAKMKEGIENKLASLRDKPMDDLLDFGQLGVDQLFVDEAHLFKNLMFVTKMQNVRGLGQAKGSQRAYDMFIKTHQIYEKNGNGRGVVFATGTPVSNSLAEMYHMLRYLAPETLKDSGQFTFDAWAKTFADVEQVWMQSLSGDGYKSSNRMSRFVNTPELLRVYDQVADTVTMDDIKQAFAEENDGADFPIPKLKGGRRTPVSIPRSQAQTDYMNEIAKRAKALEQRKGKPQKGADNMLSIMGDARKAAMDVRMVDPTITERDPEGRIAMAANNIFERYTRYNGVRGTQLVFSDMGTPKKHAEKELKEYNELMAEVAPLTDERVLSMAELGDEAAQEQIDKAEEAQRKIEAKGQDWLDAIRAAMRGFSVYDDLKEALVEKGIPENEIAFIHDYNTDDQKAALFRAVNDGKVRVILGSTEKMGAGTNVQERAVALHHLDVPWKPSDIEQREGRVIRQGNKLLDEIGDDFEVEVMAYATQDTLDLFMWQTQEKKLSMIGQLRTGNVGREVDNAFEEMQMSAGEMQAAATSNPYLLEEIQLKDKVKKLERQKRSFDGQKNDLINRQRRAEKDVADLPAQIEAAQAVEKAAKKMQDERDAHFDSLTATVNGETLTGVDAIRQAIRNAIDAAPVVEKDGKQVADINIELNGKAYTSESGIADAANKALGDVAQIAYTLPNGQTVYRGGDVVIGLIDPIADMIEAQGEAKLGKMGAFNIDAYYAKEGRIDVMVTLDGADVGDFQIVYESKEPGALNARIRSIPTEANRTIQASIGQPNYLKSKLEKANRTLSDIAAKPDAGTWPGEAELQKAREDYRAVLKKLSETGETKEQDGEGVTYSVAALRDEAELERIFADLEKRGLARNRAERMLNSDPDKAIIQYIDQNFFDILEELDDSKKVTIKC